MWLNGAKRDKPFFNKVWESSIAETSEATARNKQDLFGNYMKNIAINDKFLRYKDSDMFKQINNIKKDNFKFELDKNEEIAEMYEKNRKDTLRMFGYDPFINELDDDKPILYSKLVDFCDESTLDDGFKLNAIIEIVKLFNQAEKLNNAMAAATENPKAVFENGGLIKQLSGTKNVIISSALNLAKDNGISVLHNKDRSKGASTLSGKQKELTDIGLRDIQISMFDINTSEAMKQVAEISAKAQLDQLRLDENDYTEIIIRQREINEDLQKKADNAEEALRLYKTENVDLKDFLRDKGLLDKDGKVRG